MQSIVSRRKILIASLGAAAVGLTRTAQAAPANVPSIWDGKKMCDSFLRDGTGFSFPHKPNAPVAVVAFDTQCPDCMRLFTRIKPLLNDVDVIFYPISFMNIHYTLSKQAAVILQLIHWLKVCVRCVKH